MDHDHVRDVLDRTATRPLVDRLLSEAPDADEREEIERTLIALDDVRAVLPLHAAGENTALSPLLRHSALNVITSMLGARMLPIREWWASDDPILRFAAASVLPHREFADLVAPVLADPDHRLLARVLGSMDIGFEEDHWQQGKIRHLSHPSAAVRSAAATALLWDEPLAAEDALLHATSDLDLDVAVEAVSTLMYYPTAKVVEALRCVGESPNELLATSATAALHRVLSDIDDACRVAPGSPHLERWRALSPDERTVSSRRSDRFPLADVGSLMAAPDRSIVSWSPELERALLDPDGAWERKFDCVRRLQGDSVPIAHRARVLDLLCHHVDPEIRGGAAPHVVQWDGGAAALLDLLDDPMVTVSKAAMYSLYEVPDSCPIANDVRLRAWDAVVDGTLVGTRLSEAMRTFVRHGDALDPRDVTRRLVALLDDPRESARTAALEHLASRGEVDVLAGQLHRLGEAPEVTWSFHVTLLDAAYRYDLGVDRFTLIRLASEDHAWVSASAARLLPVR